MGKLDFCVIGDLHLEKLNSYFSYETGLEHVFTQLQKIVDYCDKNLISTVVQLGDIAETPFPTQNTIKKLLQFLQVNNHINWYFILGNHDFAYTDNHSLELASYITANSEMFSHVKIYTTYTEEVIQGIPFHFIPYPNKKAKITSFSKLCFGHFEFKGFKNDNGMEITEGVEHVDKKDIWIMGHLHHYQKRNNITYSGTLLQYSFGEKPDKGFLHCKASIKNDKLLFKDVFIPISTPYKFENVVLSTQEQVDKFIPNKESFYKIKNLIDLPEHLLKNENILKVSNTSKDEVQLEEVEKSDISISDPLYALDDFLQSKGFKNKDIKRATKFMKKIVNNII